MMERRRWGERSPHLVWGWKLDQKSGSLVLGLYLVVLGVFVWLGQQGLIERGFWRDHWPCILIAIGAGTLATARSASRVGNGVFFALVGVWFLILKSEWHGLTWRTGWPLILVAIGISVLAQGLAGLFLPEEQPKRLPSGEARGKEGDPHA